MWMMGYNELHEDHMINIINNNNNNNNTRKLRPLVPRPPPPTRFYHDHLLPQNHHHHHGEQNKRYYNPTQQMVVVSSRWNPTPEQLQSLEELYRRGTRTPSADKIQQITAQLRRYGKIEGKNVFYWFQNHKARERQKRRRQLDKDLYQPPFLATNQSIHRKDSEVEETRNWPIPTFSEKGLVIIDQQKEKEKEEEEEDDRNNQLMLLHRRRKSIIPVRNTTLTNMISCPNSPSTLTGNPTTFTTFASYSNTVSSSLVVSSHSHDMESYETLELFPVNINREDPNKSFIQTNDMINLNPRHFIEFLPLKN